MVKITYLNLGQRHTFSLMPTLFPLLTLTSTLPGPSASEATTICRYTNVYIIITVIINTFKKFRRC